MINSLGGTWAEKCTIIVIIYISVLLLLCLYHDFLILFMHQFYMAGLSLILKNLLHVRFHLEFLLI